MIHTGSRNMGLRVAELYQKKAYNEEIVNRISAFHIDIF